MEKALNILFIGDIFGKPGLEKTKIELPKIKEKYNIDFTIAQSENVSGRKGLNVKDYEKMKNMGIDAFTLGNHVWAKDEIFQIVENNDIIRPLNISENDYPGHGSSIFIVKNNIKLRVTSLLGITFNQLVGNHWNSQYANNFFDAIDEIVEKDDSDFHVVDFHAETTSEKNVLGLYLDGKVSAVLGTHTHIQTNDAKTLDNNTVYITDVGMVGPKNSAIGANFDEVYQKMRYDKMVAFKVSKNECEFNAVVLELSNNISKRNKIIPIKI